MPPTPQRRGSGGPTGAGAGAGGAAKPSPKTLSTLTLDGSLLLEVPGSNHCSPQARPPRGSAQRPRGPPRSPAAKPPSPARVCLDTGESEDAWLRTLRGHFVRNSTAETSLPLRRPSHKYAAPPASAPPGTGGPAASLEQQEGALWAEREHEQLDAQVCRAPRRSAGLFD